MTRVVSTALFVLVLGLARVATAQDPASAELLFEAGKRLWQNGEHAEACAKFQASYELDPAASTLVKLARCREEEGDLAGAVAAYTQAKKLNAESPRAKHRVALEKAIDEALASIEPRLAYVVLQVEPTGIKPVVFRDGKALPAEALGEKLVASPGKIGFRVEAEGFEPTEQTIEIGEGETRTVAMTLRPLPPPEQAPPMPEEVPGRSAQTAVVSPALPPSAAPPSLTGYEVGGIAVGSAGLAALAVGGGLGVATLVKVSASSAHCDAEDFCDPDGLRLRQQAGDLQIAGIVSGAAGAALVGIGALLYFGPWEQDVAISVGPAAVELTGSF